MSFTIKNLREVEDVAGKHGLGETQEARFAREDLGAQDTGVAFQTVRPGRRQAFAHRHEQAEEVYVVVSGSGRVKVDDEVAEIGPLDAIRIAPAAVRAFEGGPDGLEMIVFGPHHKGDGEIIREDVWGED